MTKTLAVAAALVLAAPLVASACPGAKATSASNGDYTPITTAQAPAGSGTQGSSSTATPKQ